MNSPDVRQHFAILQPFTSNTLVSYEILISCGFHMFKFDMIQSHLYTNFQTILQDYELVCLSLVISRTFFLHIPCHGHVRWLHICQNNQLRKIQHENNSSDPRPTQTPKIQLDRFFIFILQ